MTNANLSTPVGELPVGHLLDILEQRYGLSAISRPQGKRYVYGIAGIAELFNFSKSSAARLKKSGKIDEAITQVGQLIIVDAQKALELTDKPY